MKNFVHLHNHSTYSLLDGVSDVKLLAKKAKELGMPAIALTDHGLLSGCIKHYMACISEGIKPILGMEAYLAKNAKSKDKIDNKNYHLLLLAKNNTGWLNLMMLSSLAYERENFYYRPRVDFDMLDKYGEGLIISSGCIMGEISQMLLAYENEAGYEAAKIIALKYKERFGDDYYLELMFHCKECNGIAIKDKEMQKKQTYVLEQTKRLALDLNIPTIITNDSHFVNKEDFKTREIKKWVQFRDKDSSDVAIQKSIDSGNTELYLKSQEEMYEYFGEDYTDSLERTLEIADKCNVELAVGSKAKIRLPDPNIEAEVDYPHFCLWKDNPENYKKIFHLDKASQYLCYKTYAGLVEKGLYNKKEYIDRLEYELAVITKTDFAKYFLLIYKFPQWARDNNILPGGGRGSAAGVLISYLLDITADDPMLHDLPFERFLSAEYGYVVEKRDLI